MKKKHFLNIEHWQLMSVLLVIYDILTIAFSYFFALWLRFDLHMEAIDPDYITWYGRIILPYVAVCLASYAIFRLYKIIWRYASIEELLNIFIAITIPAVLNVIAVRRAIYRMPVSYFLIGYIMQIVMAIIGRYAYRLVLLLRSRKKDNDFSKVMLIGAGQAGQEIIRDINKTRQSHAKVVCIIDDLTNKQGRYVEGVPVVGGREDILAKAKEYDIDQIYFAIPSAKATDKREILGICEETGCDVKVLPGYYQIVNGDVSMNMMKDVAIEDLLGRETIKVNDEEIFGYIKGKIVLVTGGGGSIGSELCRQIAAHNPKQLIIFDVYENNAYDIQQELIRKYHDELNLKVLIGSVRDSKRIDKVFKDYKPDIVYHAAAHKHVPLMEDSPCEAIKNNVIGTFKTAYAAVKYGTKRFVLISTDKAVNPANVMGATKRMCEMVIQTFDKLTKEGSTDKLAKVEDCFSVSSSTKLVNRTEFVAVRFGNVLGSNGSVIPLFKKQIECGGPVTVTHPDIIRYFMTIPEAVSLVLQAGAYAKGGEIFVLDMGDPVKIDTLARNLIKLSGLQPDVDIKIVYTGLRPGEKLYEEKLMAAEGNRKTDNDLIFVGKPLDLNEDDFIANLKDIYEIAMENDEEKTVRMIGKIVPTFNHK